ncbi:MAG: DUF4230 domain-containing protein [Mobilitalea sp.]
MSKNKRKEEPVETKEEMREKMKEGKNRNVARAVINLLTVVVIVCAVIYVTNKVLNLVKSEREPVITNTLISDKLEEVSELTSAKLTYNGLIHYTDGKIPILTKKAFLMTYRAEVEAGIVLSEVDINVTVSNVKITIPEIKILDISVDPDSIEFFDEKAALFNWTEKEDVVDAMQVAKDDVTENANIDELKSKAKEQTEVLLEGLFEDAIGDRKLVISYK